MKARRYNEEGVQAFETFVFNARKAFKASLPVESVPQGLLVDESLTEATEYKLPEGEIVFPTKLAIGEMMSSIIPESRHEDARMDVGLWSWFAAKYFDEITKNRTKLKEPRAYIAGLNHKEFYRHLILGPYYLYFIARDNPDRVKVLLYDEPTTMNEVMVQFGSYQTLMQNRGIQGAIQRLYFDEQRGRTKRGAGGKLAGTPRRLMDFFRQIELNYDLSSISENSIWAMIPKEFSRFKKAAISSSEDATS